jgi:hypothetical protein
MWLVPTGYCFVLQAGSIANDLFGAVFALAALDYALRARESKRHEDLWLSILSAALLTGSKASNLPLLLPWAVAILPCAPLLRQRLIGSVAVALLAVVCSLVPLSLINIKYSGDWTGIHAEKVELLEHGSFLNVANNAVLLGLQNLSPPVFPFASTWNSSVQRLMPDGLREKLEHSFEPGGAHWQLGELQIEEAAGLGFGVTVLVLLSLAICLMRADSSHVNPRPTPNHNPTPAAHLLPDSNAIEPTRRRLGLRLGIGGGMARWHNTVILASAWLALLAFMFRSGLTNAARLVTPYYALLVPSLLLFRCHLWLIGRSWWRALSVGVFAIAALLLILSPSRPLWPARQVLPRMRSDSGLIARAKAVYSVFSVRADAFAPIRALLPPAERTVGLVASDDPETSLWRPFGQRRIFHVTQDDSLEDLLTRDIHYVVVNPKKLTMFFDQSFEQWLKTIHGDVVAQVTLPLRVTLGPSDWCIVKIGSDKRE